MNPNLARTLKFRAAQSKTEVFTKTLQARDNNDCTVIAFQALTGVDYYTAFRHLKNMGRRFWGGLSHSHINEYVASFEKFGCLTARVSATTEKGNFLVLFHDHAMAMVNGVSINGFSFTPVMAIYEVVKVD